MTETFFNFPLASAAWWCDKSIVLGLASASARNALESGSWGLPPISRPALARTGFFLPHPGIGSVIREQRPAIATTRKSCEVTASRTAARPDLVVASESSRPRPVNRLQATGEPRRVMRGGSKSCALGSKKQDGPEPAETQGKLSLSPKNRVNKAEYQVYLQSDHWKALRRKRLEASNYKCDKCGSAYYLQVHHIRYRRIYDVQVSDLRTVCRYCHEKEHGIVSGFRPIRPDSNELLKRVFHQPEKRYESDFKPVRHNQKQIREILQRNKLTTPEEIRRIQKENAAWKTNQSNRQH